MKLSVSTINASKIEPEEAKDKKPAYKKLPNIYALTSDLNQRIKAQLKQIGFKNVHQELNEPQLREIFEESQLIFNDNETSEENSEKDSSFSSDEDDADE